MAGGAGVARQRADAVEGAGFVGAAIMAAEQVGVGRKKVEHLGKAAGLEAVAAADARTFFEMHNFGQVVRKNYPVVVGNRVRGAQRETVSVVGPLCTPLDLLADNLEMAKADVGDLIAVFQSGAYGLTASPTAFLGHPPPAEILV